tara:strand:- start:12098 stop:12442 length:345 start_codon:yes stop_codon:yes gene_type:complete
MSKKKKSEIVIINTIKCPMCGAINVIGYDKCIGMPDKVCDWNVIYGYVDANGVPDDPNYTHQMKTCQYKKPNGCDYCDEKEGHKIGKCVKNCKYCEYKVVKIKTKYSPRPPPLW